MKRTIATAIAIAAATAIGFVGGKVDFNFSGETYKPIGSASKTETLSVSHGDPTYEAMDVIQVRRDEVSDMEAFRDRLHAYINWDAPDPSQNHLAHAAVASANERELSELHGAVCRRRSMSGRRNISEVGLLKSRNEVQLLIISARHQDANPSSIDSEFKSASAFMVARAAMSKAYCGAF